MDFSVFIEGLQKFVTVGLLVATTITGFILNSATKQLSELEARSGRDKVFSDALFSQVNTLASGGAKARMAFLGLWVLARDDEAKNGLFEVAVVSESDDLKKVADSLTQKGYSEADIQASKTLGNAKAALIAQVSVANPMPSPKVDPKATGASVALLANLTPPTMTGYIYLGTVTRGQTKLAQGKTIDGATVPAVGDSVTPVTDVHLRDSYPTNTDLGQVIGIVDQTDRLHVSEIKSYDLSKNAQAVWAKVTVLEPPSPGPATPPK